MALQSPYPGLRPFDRDETEVFFGREEQVDELLDRLSQHRFLAVVGVSGCGKSSLVRAGVLPALEELGHDDEPPWRIAEMRPGHRPVATLARVLLDSGMLERSRHAAPNADEFLAAALRRGPLGLIEVLTESGATAWGRLLILVDQFEEVFRYHRLGDPDAGAAFVELLLASAAAPEIPVYVMLTMRSDFIGDCALFPGLPEALNRSQFLTPRLSREQRRAAIAGPAAVFSGTVEPRLVNRILNDMGNDPDQLPLMQHALMRVWQQAAADHAGSGHEGPVLTLSEYDAVGGFGKALSMHANEAYAELGAADQAIASHLFRSLCDKGPGDVAVRRPVQLQEVADVAAAAADVARVVEVFRRPGRSFLTPRADTPLTPETVLDISHESLIRHWDKMTAWYQDEQRAASDYRRLLESARRWQAGEADLLGQRDLDHALAWRRREKPNPAWARRYGGGLTDALAFLDKSVRHRKKKRFLWVGTVLTVGILAILALRYQASLKASEQAHHYSEAVRLAVQADQARSDYSRRAIILAYEAVRESELTGQRIAIAEQSLRDAIGSWTGTDSRVLSGHADRINALAYSPDGRTLASGSEDGSVRLWATESGLLLNILAGHAGGVTILAYNSDGRSLASAGRDNTVRLWDASTGEPLAPPLPHDGPITALTYSPDGRTLGTVCRAGARDYGKSAVYRQEVQAQVQQYQPAGGAAGTVQAWDAHTGHRVAAPIRHDKDILTIASGRAERTLTFGFLDMEGNAWVADSLTEEPLTPLPTPGDEIITLALSSDGRQLASGALDGAVSLWNISGGTRPLRLQASDAAVVRLTFSPDGKKLAAVYRDGTAGVWDTQTGMPSTPLLQTESGIGGLFFAPDGQIMATLGPWDNTVSLWRAGGERLNTLTGHTGDIVSMAFSPDGGFLASGAADNTIRLWDLKRNWIQKTPVVLGNYTAPVMAAAVLPGRDRGLIVVSRKGVYRKAGDLEKAARPTDGLNSPCEDISLTAPSADGGQVAMICRVRNRKMTRAIYEENILFVWELTKVRAPVEVTLTGLEGRGLTVTALAVDAGGRRLYIGDQAGGLRRWELDRSGPAEFLIDSSLKPPAKAATDMETSPDGEKKTALTALALSRDGRRMLVGTEHGELVLWDLETGADPSPRTTLQARGTAVTAARFTRDGGRMLSADRAGVIRVWDAGDPDAAPDVLKGHSSAVNALALSDDGRWLLSGSDDTTARLWDLADPEPSYAAIVLWGHKGGVTTVGFDRDEQWFITGSNDRTVRLWTRRLDELKQKARTAAGRNLTADEWKQYFRGERCRKTFDEFPSGCGN